MTWMHSPRCVLDTNVIISAVLKPESLPNRLVAHVFEHGAVLVSEALLEELRSRIMRPTFDRYVTVEDRERIVALFARRGHRVTVASVVTDSRDPDDNAVLALALDGQADMIVSGDRKHLLPLHPFRGIAVLTPREAATRFSIA